jgi:hypothetical protein
VHAAALRQLAYGACAVVGLVSTWYLNLTDTGAAPYLSAWFANASSSAAAVDLLVAFPAAPSSCSLRAGAWACDGPGCCTVAIRAGCCSRHRRCFCR